MAWLGEPGLNISQEEYRREVLRTIVAEQGIDEDLPFAPADVLSVTQAASLDWDVCGQFAQLVGGAIVEISLEEYNLLLHVLSNGNIPSGSMCVSGWLGNEHATISIPGKDRDEIAAIQQQCGHDPEAADVWRAILKGECS